MGRRENEWKWRNSHRRELMHVVTRNLTGEAFSGDAAAHTPETRVTGATVSWD